MKNITIVGAGKIGTSIAKMLLSSKFSITIADTNQTALDQFEIKNIDKLFIEDDNKLLSHLEKEDYLINAGPYHISFDMAELAYDSNTNYFDLTEDVQQTEEIQNLAETELDLSDKNIVLMPQCGLAPGFISIIANHLAKGFDSVNDIKMRVGALPMYPNNHLKYNMTWSTEGLVNEYLHTGHAIKDGRLASVDPLEGYEIFSINGDRYEAFNTSGGLGSMTYTWYGKVENMDYKSIRYVGHRDLMKFLIDDLKLGNKNGKKLKKILDKSIPSTDQDVVLIFVTVNGIKNGKLTQETWAKKIYGIEYNGYKFNAIQATTAAGICGIINLHASGNFPTNKGLIRQEDIDFDKFMAIGCVKAVYDQ